MRTATTRGLLAIASLSAMLSSGIWPLASSDGIATAQGIVQYRATLNGASEVPTTASTAAGAGTAALPRAGTGPVSDTGASTPWALLAGGGVALLALGAVARKRSLQRDWTRHR